MPNLLLVLATFAPKAYHITPSGLSVDLRCEDQGFYYFVYWYPAGKIPSVSVLDPKYSPYKSFFLVNALPFNVFTPGLSEALSLVPGLGVMAVDAPGIYTLVFESPETTRINLLSLSKPYPPIYNLEKDQEIKVKVKLSSGEQALLFLLSSDDKEVATVRILDPDGREITPKSSNKTQNKLLVVPFLATSAGEYICVVKAKTKGSFVLLVENLSKSLEAQ